MSIILNVLVTLVMVLIIGTILQATYFKSKLRKVKPYGKLVDVNGEKMHVYSMGSGEKTIVLLPGMGVALPCADFGPLMRKLSENYTVVCVEYFGVGFSDVSLKPRTIDNYIEEIRIALKQSGFNAPYLLMPHSISSIYSEYYASKYESELEGIISLDGTSTNYYDELPKSYKKILTIAKFQQTIGMCSALAPLMLNKNNLRHEGYTEKEIKDMIIFSGFSLTKTVLNQMENAIYYVKETMKSEYPKSIPYFKVISKQTYETPNNQLKITPMEYQHQHLEKIGEHAKFEVLDGNHFIYKNNLDKILNITNEFIHMNTENMNLN